MTTSSDVETADRLSRRRSRLLPVLALVFISGQAMYFGNASQALRTVDTVRISAWLVWSIVLLVLLATGGGFFRSKAVRALMEDEVTIEHRRRGLATGFWAAMLSAIVIYPLSIWEPVTAREAIHIVLTAGIGAALLRFGFLERRALKDG